MRNRLAVLTLTERPPILARLSIAPAETASWARLDTSAERVLLQVLRALAKNTSLAGSIR